MTDQYLGEIRLFAGNFAPNGWALCNGQILSIAQNTALFSLLGTYYGGNGTSNFALPDLRGRVPIQQGQGPGLSPYDLGQSSGSETVTVTLNEIPVHTHVPQATTNPGDSSNATNTIWAAPSPDVGDTPYSTAANDTTMHANALTATGGNQPHNNIMPYQTLNYIIAMQGIFPPRG